MKFPRAYCQELEREISPYQAREYYFDETSEYYSQKLTFLCPDAKCRKEIASVGVYLERKSKRALHYRGMKTHEHHEECDFWMAQQNAVKGNADGENSQAIRNQIPSEFILKRKKAQTLKRLDLEEKIDVDAKDTRSSFNNASNSESEKEYHFKTSSLENVVDCFRNIDEEILKKERLTINGITRFYRNCFKNIKYHQDAKGLIYWGTVKQIKEYGKNFAITFKEAVWYDNSSKSVSIYITKEQIEKYRKKNLFRQHLIDLKSNESEILCFFTGTYPELKEVEVPNGSFQTFQIDIHNLDHICFEF